MTPLESLCLRHGVAASTEQRDDGSWLVTLRARSGEVIGTASGRTLDAAVHAHAQLLDGSALMEDAVATAAERRLVGHRYHVRRTWARDGVELAVWERGVREAPRYTVRAPSYAGAVTELARVLP